MQTIMRTYKEISKDQYQGWNMPLQNECTIQTLRRIITSYGKKVHINLKNRPKQSTYENNELKMLQF